MVGYYRKSWPCCPSPTGVSMDDGYPSRELIKTFDLDFGRVGLQTCFDMNFDDTWHQLYAANVDIVFWPSAYGGGMPIRGYAQVYHYNIVPVGWGDITDITGQVAQGLHAVVPKKMYMATLDLDRTYTHDDFIGTKVEQLVRDNNETIEFISVPEHCAVDGQCSQSADLVRESGFYLLGRTEKGYEQGVSVRALLKENNIETLRQYQHRARAALNMQRQAAAPHPTLLKRNDTAGGAFLKECKWNAQDSTKATKFGANVTCEPLVPDADATVSMHAEEGAKLDDVLYVDTRTTVYTEPPAPLADPKKSRIKVASIAGLQCCVPAAKVNSSLQLALTKLDAAGKLGVDVALLPEEFMCGEAECALDIDGPEVAQLSAMAKKHSMWIVFGMRATAPEGDPYPVDPARGTKKLGYNTDVILDRQGKNIGYYRKSWPCCPGPDGTTMDDGYPSRELVKTFDTEFGRVGLQTCFDMNFMDTWHELYAQVSCCEHAHLLRHFILGLRLIISQRQARDTHRENSKTRDAFSYSMWTLSSGRAPTAAGCRSGATRSSSTTTSCLPAGVISLTRVALSRTARSRRRRAFSRRSLTMTRPGFTPTSTARSTR
jgi:predicted amidohydrolase